MVHLGAHGVRVCERRPPTPPPTTHPRPTSQEAVNWHRYPYLRAPGGGFHNPHDAGCYANWREVLRGGRGGSRSGSRGPLLGGGGGWGGV